MSLSASTTNPRTKRPFTTRPDDPNAKRFKAAALAPPETTTLGNRAIKVTFIVDGNKLETKIPPEDETGILSYMYGNQTFSLQCNVAEGTMKIFFQNATPGEEAVFLPLKESPEHEKFIEDLQKKCKKKNDDKIAELQQAIDQNLLKLQTSIKDYPGLFDKIVSVFEENELLKQERNKFLANNASGRVEVRVQDVCYEVAQGQSAVLDELPGRPSLLWTVDGGTRVSKKEWTHVFYPPPSSSLSLQDHPIHFQETTSINAGPFSDKKRIDRPSGIAMDETHIYVAMPFAREISVFCRDTYQFLKSYGIKGNGADGRAYNMVVDDKHVYVTLHDSDFVSVMTKDGDFVRTIGDQDGQGRSVLNNPCGIAVDAEHIVVSNYGTNSISIFLKSTGEFLQNFGTSGDGEAQLDRPLSVALDGDLVYVADQCNDRVKVFTKKGAFVRVIGQGAGNKPGQMHEPTDVAVDKSYIYVCDRLNDRVQIFTKADGEYVSEVNFSSPGGKFIALHGKMLAVLDNEQKKITFFRA